MLNGIFRKKQKCPSRAWELRDTPIDGNGVAKDAKVYSHFVTI